MENYSYKTRGTCSREIRISIDGNRIASVQYIGGCNGNTKGVSALVRGLTIDEVIARLDGIDCNGRGTSCPDQLARALKEIKAAR